MDNARQMMEIDFTANPYEAAEGADVAVLVTEWNEFRALDLDRLKTIMNTPVFVDLRNVYRAHEVEPHGFAYHSIGKNSG
ncbi:UDP-glucose 6-dehydrogenase TuaD [compost metagenome]